MVPSLTVSSRIFLGEAFDMTVDTTMIERTSSVGLEVLDRLNHGKKFLCKPL
jgi:hypothetical protein